MNKKILIFYLIIGLLLLGCISLSNSGMPCKKDSDCGEEGKCLYPIYSDIDYKNREGICAYGMIGDRCRSAEDCKSGYCGPIDVSGNYDFKFVCTTGSLGEGCRYSSDCSSGFCGHEVEWDGVIGKVRRICTDGKPGAGCETDAECLSKKCSNQKKCI